MKRRSFVIIIFVLAIIFFVFLSITYPKGNSGNGKLTIQTQPTELAVIVDGAVVGKTPLDKYTISSGKHLVSIGDNWKEQILVTSGNESVIVRDFTYGTELSFGYSIGYEQIGNIFGRPTQLVVTSSPINSTVYVGETSVGATPLVLQKDQLINSQIRVVKEGYEDASLSLTLSNDLTTRLDVSLLVNPLSTLGKVDVKDTIQNYSLDPSVTIPITARYQWGNSRSIDASPVITPWNRIEIWGIQNQSATTEELIKTLDEYYQLKYHLLGVPFAYIIDTTGAIYEGLGLFDFDYSQVTYNSTTYSSGTAPILIIFNDGNLDLTDPIVRSIKWLSRYFEQDPGLSARFIGNIDPINIKAGENKTIDLQYQNTSPLIWRKDTFYQVIIKTTQKEPSEFYDPSLWKSPTQITNFSNEVVYPGDIASFSLPLKAPYYNGDFHINIVLFDVARNVDIENSQQTLSVTVTNGTGKTLIVKDTPTGYLNVRSGPGVSYQLLTTIFTGERFAWVKEEDGWYQILLRDGTSGWVTNTYVEVK